MKFLATFEYIFIIYLLIFLLDFIVVTINLIQLLAAILIRINYVTLPVTLPTGLPIRKRNLFFSETNVPKRIITINSSLYSLPKFIGLSFVRSIYRKRGTWRLEAIPQLRKTCRYVSLRNAFLRDRICGNMAYATVSRNGYLNSAGGNLSFS